MAFPLARCLSLLACVVLPADAWLSTGAPRCPSTLPLAGRQALLHSQVSFRRSADVIMQRAPKQSKKDVLELEGVVVEALPSATFRVQLDDTEQAHLS